MALFNAATTRMLRGAPISTAIAEYERGLEIERQIGDRGQVAWMLLNIAFEYLMIGDPVQAGHRLDEAEPIATGAAVSQAALIRAMQRRDEGELESARAQLEHVVQVYLEAGRGRGYELNVLGEVLMAQGRIDQARTQIERFLALDQPHESTWYLNGRIAYTDTPVTAGSSGSIGSACLRGITVANEPPELAEQLASGEREHAAQVGGRRAQSLGQHAAKFGEQHLVGFAHPALYAAQVHLIGPGDR